MFSVWISLGSSCQELFARLLESVGLCLSPNLGEIQLLFFNLKILILFLFFWDSDHTNVRSFVIVPQVPEVLGILRFFLFSLAVVGGVFFVCLVWVSFFCPFSPCLLFRQGSFYCSIFTFTYSFLCHLHLYYFSQSSQS